MRLDSKLSHPARKDDVLWLFLHEDELTTLVARILHRGHLRGLFTVVDHGYFKLLIEFARIEVLTIVAVEGFDEVVGKDRVSVAPSIHDRLNSSRCDRLARNQVVDVGVVLLIILEWNGNRIASKDVATETCLSLIHI